MRQVQEVQAGKVADGPTRGAVAPAPAPKTPTAPKTATSPRVRENDQLKFHPAAESRQRRIVARVAGLALLGFFSAAVYAALAHRSFAPLPVGSNLLVETALIVWPQAWPLAVLHDALAGCAALMVLLAVTRGHVGLPGDPRLSDTYVWRRQARFAWPRLLLGAALFAVGFALEWHGHPLLAALAESPGFAFVLSACTHLWIPIARRFLVVETDWARDGLSNRLSIGGGLRGFRCGTLVVWHHHLLDVQKCANLWEWCFGLAALKLRFLDADGQQRVIVLRALGSAALVQHIEVFLKGPFKAARIVAPPNVIYGRAPPTYTGPTT